MKNIKRILKIIFKGKIKLLLKLKPKTKYTVSDLILIKKELTEQLKKDNKAFQSYIPKRKEMTNEEQLGLAAKAFRKQEEIIIKQNDLNKVTLAILKFNVKSGNNENIQKLSTLKRLKEMYSTGIGKRKYTYSAFYRKLKFDELLSNINNNIGKLEQRLIKINSNLIQISGLSFYSKKALEMALPF